MGTMTPRWSRFYAAIQIAAIAIIVLSFMTWVTTTVSANMTNILGPRELLAAHLNSFDYRGSELRVFTGADGWMTTGGDGWLSAILGFVIFIAAWYGHTARSHLPNAFIAIAGMLVVALMVYILGKDWPGQFADRIERDIHYTWEFWTTLALARSCGIAGFTMLSTNHHETGETATEEIVWA